MSLSLDRALAHELRREFPVLNQEVNGRRLVYLDSAATTQKPRPVIEAIVRYYENDNANVHRGVHELSRRATDAFEAARSKIRAFINAAEDREILFTKGCTEAVNLVANTWGAANLFPGDEILVSTSEHHANIVPWQLAAARTGAAVRPIPIADTGEIDLVALQSLLTTRVKMVAIKHVCNALGTINPVAEIARMAHQAGARVLVDGAQGLAHEVVDVRALGVDFYTISGHKVYGPTGVGALYGRRELLEAMPPYQGGGDMIRTVSFEGTTFNDLPNRFEAGTPNIAGAIGLGAAIDFVRQIGIDALRSYEHALVGYARERLREIDGLRQHGPTGEKAGIFSLTMTSAHPHDIGTVLDEQGVAVRTGHHCCMPLMKRLGVPATARASFSITTDEEDVDRLVQALKKTQEIFA